MEIRTAARIGAIALTGVAITLAALALREAPVSEPPSAQAAPNAADDPLEARLQRCQRMGTEAADDPDCLDAWKQNRERFFGIGRARHTGPRPSNPSPSKVQ